MTQMINRPPAEVTPSEAGRKVPAHPHYTLGTISILGLVLTIGAVILAVIALGITAGRNSVDDALVSEKVDTFLGENGAAAATGDVIPALVPKADLPVATDVAVATAPDMPPAPARTTPAIVEVSFEVVEGVNAIDPANGVEFQTWGYRIVGGDTEVVSGTPGPVIRARVGDVLRFTITNPEGNVHPHNVDFHAVTGQGGGAEATTVAPGETKTIEARLLYPGFFMYHCAYGDIAQHISHGMYGGILVDPETPLPTVDHEWYIVQSEFYTTGKEGLVELDRAAVRDENPTYVVFNGAVGAIAGDNALAMQVGERSRIYFINAGINLISSFHPIGSHWDKVYPEATLLSAPLRGSQTTLIPAGGGTVVELVGQVPSTLVLVDHALARAIDKGAIGQIVVSGEANPEIFSVGEGESIVGGEGHDMTPPEGGSETTVAAAPVGGESIDIMAGSSAFQDMDSPDEFAENESPADYSVNVITVKAGTTITWTNQDNM
ncbi:MAG TPA: multicopper oxidase domain-containing protein, partial [Acidimicrobiia bacterium]|nr:multicopper oxidase domain-containing protein [Acidimicrobiia bacterium]